MSTAIPTKYAGVQFRSRLEARWAAFFDLVGWKWEYEPLDLNGYIPDFVVTAPLDRPWLVEVKPFSELPCHITGCRECGPSDLDRSVYDETVRKVRRSGWTGNALLVGASLRSSQAAAFNEDLVPRIGRDISAWREHDEHDPGERCDDRWAHLSPWDDERILVQCRRCPRIMIRAELRDGEEWEWFNSNRWCDCDDSDRFATPFDPTTIWRSAGNVVQWHSKESL